MSDPVTPAKVVTKIPHTKIIRIGENVFIEKDDAGVTDDLFQEIRDIS